MVASRQAMGWVCAAMGVLAFCAPGTRGQEVEVDWEQVDEWIETGQTLVRPLLPPEWREQLEAVDAAALESLLSSLETAWEEPGPETLARLQPAYRQALDLLRSVPDAESLVQWMDARAPYLEVARRSVEPAPPPPVPPVEPAVETGTTPPPPVPPKVPTPPSKVPSPAPRPPWTPGPYWTDPDLWDREVSMSEEPKNARKWIRELSPVFREEGLPPELIWIAEVESTFQPRARSPVGAVGLFQLMPATAKHYGLRVAFPDQRKIPEKNARAAARYLRDLYGRFRSWPLALAAYHAGPTRVARLLSDRKTKRFDGIRSALPVETQMYVPRVEAVLRMRTGAKLATLPGPGGTPAPRAPKG